MGVPYWDRMLEFWIMRLQPGWKKSKVWYNGKFIVKTLDLAVLTPGMRIALRKKFSPLDDGRYLNNDLRALLIAQSVRECFVWKSDLHVYGKDEFWQKFSKLAPLLLKDEKVEDDCDGIATAMAGVMIVCGVPYWRVWINAGLVYPFEKDCGHAYVTYLPEGLVNKYAIIESSWHVSVADRQFMNVYANENSQYQTPWWKFTEGQSLSKRRVELSGKDFLREAEGAV